MEAGRETMHGSLNLSPVDDSMWWLLIPTDTSKNGSGSERKTTTRK